MVDLNINFLRYNEDHNSTDFLDEICSCSLIPRITSRTRFTPRSKTLKNKIFSTDTANEVIAGNILKTFSDHLAQFLLFPIKKTKPESKANTYCRNFKQFDPKYSYSISITLIGAQQLNSTKKMLMNDLISFSK